MKKYALITCLAAVLVFSDSCAVNPVTGKKQVVLMSEAQEIAMGQEADPQIIQEYGLYEDKAIQDFVSARGKKIAAVSHRPDLNYEFRVIDSEVLNAFAIPGGYVYITRGIMAHFNNEAELAGVVGHEIGHIAARHSVAQQRNQILGQIGLIAGIVVAPKLAQFADQLSQGLGLLFLKFSRDAEREADELGVEYSSKTGYDAREMALFFKTLERQAKQSGEGELPDFLSTHPNPGDRNVTVTKLATEWREKLNLTNTTVNRDSYLKLIDGIIYGEDPKQGFVENFVFYHPVLKLQFQFPRDWIYQNSPQTFQMAPKNGRAMMMLTMAPGKSLQEAANAVLRQNGLTLLESRQVNVNGLPALSMVSEQQQQQGGTIRALSYLIQYENNIYHLLGVTASADFNSYMPVFANSMQSFRQLNDASKLNKQPERVRLKTVRTSTTFEQALRSYNVAAKRMEETAILNGMELKDKVAAGTLIKVIEP
jgi:predicted Zn-dependent protease